MVPTAAKDTAPDDWQQLEDAWQDCQAWMNVLEHWDVHGGDAFPREAYAVLERETQPRLDDVADGLEEAAAVANAEKRAALRKDIDSALAEVQAMIDAFCRENAAALSTETKAFFARQKYRVGVSYDRDPTDRLAKWALFGEGMFRMNSFWQRGGNDLGRIDETITDSLAKLELARKWGLESMLIVNVKPLPQVPEDFVFTQNLVPDLRRSFWGFNYNSAGMRDALQEAYRTWGERTADVDNILVYQMNNEPFWSTAANPILGYDPMTIGCSVETWKGQVQERYPDLAAWRSAIPDTASNGRNHVLLEERPLGAFFPWDSLADVQFDLSRARGLTFVQFLKNRYGSLEALNAAWYGPAERGRWFAAWEEVFPPLPTARRNTGLTGGIDPSLRDIPEQWIGDLSELPTPAREDAPAWTDWAEFWAWTVNDFLVENMRALKAGGVQAPVTTNAVVGHCINNYLFNAADTGLFAWTTSDGLDALGIDFYVLDFLQAYMGILRGAANGREFFIHETNYLDPQAGQFVAMYCFAFGASGTSFWLFGDVHDVPARGSEKIFEVIRAMDDEDLQHASSPVSDGVALWYSLDTLYLNDALSGSPESYLQEVQVGVAALTRLQRLYDVYADRQLREGVPAQVQVLFAPGVVAVDDRALASAKDFVQRGGTLLVPPDFARYDRYGRTRSQADLAWLKNNPHVQRFDAEALRVLRKGMTVKSAAWPFNWAALALSPALKDIGEKLAAADAPRVRYLSAEGELSPRQAALRESEEFLYVFVDPWSSDVTVELDGSYSQARELFSGARLPVTEGAGKSRIHIDQGPALLKLPRTR
ncbi:beta-galactosidase [Ruficoccus amylovorans]|uniref:Beta-galactosidase n=2 Tax=Ruficoccus amylovorans TaxID=1804625 RepID=A0A842HAU9_9BACT|nr:beta-galactosidase [Ruficoccus amylovorans]MBC2593249.1 beta-galactosidase [Ruficoccus amylovorans]